MSPRLAAIRRTRRRIAAAVAATFVLAWGVVAFDGSKGTTTASVTPLSASPSSSGTSSSGTSSSSSDPGSSSSGSSSSSATGPLTTRQS
ncbi:MAG TPA: hypothetical protein VNS09_26070 [Solirubrobacter sp.]|nr:hypothetical protein [Solirubrobacter sp.]